MAGTIKRAGHTRTVSKKVVGPGGGYTKTVTKKVKVKPTTVKKPKKK
jgi:hypothetical protein